MGRFIFVSLGLLVVAFSLTGGTKRCPSSWLHKPGFCYKVFDDPKNWNDAKLFCRKYKPGCHLVSIHNTELSQDLAEYISDYINVAKPVWIGLNDPEQKDQWEWEDRSRTNYVAWADDQPNNSDDKLCVQLKSTSRYSQWKAANCEELHPFLCQCR